MHVLAQLYHLQAHYYMVDNTSNFPFVLQGLSTLLNLRLRQVLVEAFLLKNAPDAVATACLSKDRDEL